MKTAMLVLASLMAFYALSSRSWAQVRDDYEDLSQTSASFEAWCNNRLRELKRSQESASRQVLRGNFAGSVEILITGLAQASQSPYGQNPPLTQKLIMRGEIMGKNLLKFVASQPNGIKGVNLFLEAHYKLIETVANRIDLPYYRPGRCGYCQRPDTREFDQAVAEVASLQLTQTNQALTFSHAPLPLGPTDLYLRAMEMTTYFVSFDLRSTLYASYHACEIHDLERIHRGLKSFNSSVQSEFAKRDMFFDTYNGIRDIRINRYCY